MHVPVMRHKDAWAEERRAPKVLDPLEDPPQAVETRRAHLVGSVPNQPELPKDVLIVASKLKQYISAKAGLNTSANVMDRLSEMVRHHCDRAIERARADGRKTVLDRDFIA